jgi:hypothetical protein
MVMDYMQTKNLTAVSLQTDETDAGRVYIDLKID